MLLLTGFYPIQRTWRANRRTTLRHAVVWAGCAWAAWCMTAGMSAVFPGMDAPLSSYVALCLTGCAAVAVLGARRPGVAAWNFVVAGLLAVLLLPVAEGFGEIDPNLFEMTLALLAAALLVGFVNYLPTRAAAVVFPVGVACAVEMIFLMGFRRMDRPWGEPVALAMIGVAPWLGWAARLGTSKHAAPPNELDREWQAFRNRFGLVWGLPARDQFNRAAANGKWGVVLEWSGFRPADARPIEALAGLRAVLKRFGSDEEHPA